MRVVAGAAKGRRLRGPPGLTTRPTSDRVREAVFNALASLDAVAGSRAVDLFAGSGAMGIEALSRGATSCTFVDDDPEAVDTIRANLEHTGFSGPGVTVVREDVLRWLRGAPAVDLAMVDPPYAFEHWDTLLDRLAATVAVLESDRPLEPPARWRVLRQKRYGATVVTLVSSS